MPNTGLRDEQRADRVDDVAERGRVAGAVGEEERVGVASPAAPRRASCTGAARARAPRSTKLRTIEPLMPVSIAAIRRPPPSPVDARLARRHLAREVAPAIDGSARDRARAPRPRPSRREDAAAHRAGVADVADERARVDAGDRRDAASASQSSQPRSAPGASSRLTASRMIAAARVDAVGLHRRGADAVVADVRVGEGDELAGEARVGHRLLVAGHAGREDDLADDVAAARRRRRRRSACRPRAGRRRVMRRPPRTRARGRRRRRRRPSAARGRAACGRRSSSSPSGSRSRPRRRPTRPSRSTRHEVGRRADLRSAAAAGRAARRRRVSCSTTSASGRTPGSTSSV